RYGANRFGSVIGVVPDQSGKREKAREGERRGAASAPKGAKDSVARVEKNHSKDSVVDGRAGDDCMKTGVRKRQFPHVALMHFDTPRHPLRSGVRQGGGGAVTRQIHSSMVLLTPVPSAAERSRSSAAAAGEPWTRERT